MTTALFVLCILFLFSKVLSMVDGQRASSEVGSYLHYEYNMVCDDRTAMAQLRNI